MPRYVKMDGQPTTASDPDRFVWYSSRCHFWTDDVASLKKVGPGIPVCPDCGAVGFQTTHAKYVEANPNKPKGSCDGYRKMTSFLGV